MIEKNVINNIIKEYEKTACSLNYLEKKYKVSRNSIAKYLKKTGIPTKYFKHHLINERDVVNKYVIDRARVEDIADIYHCSIHPINDILKKYKVKRKQSESLKGRLVGNKNPNWKGGITKYDEYTKNIKGFKYRMRAWSGKILERDDFSCKMCGGDEKLEAHHIIPVRELNPVDLFNINNGITICRRCHMKIHLREKEYAEQFKKMISGSV